jgi:hypothetical protein
VNGGMNGKSQEIEGSSNANDVWVWMRPHIGFCTKGKCSLISFFLSIESLPAACKFHHLFFLFFLKHGAFQMMFHLFCFSILTPFSFSSFFEDHSFCWGEILLIGIF